MSDISTEAVLAATGRTWDEWFEELDARNGADLSHKGRVNVLRDDLGLAKPWWQQEVAVAYERARGLRAVGQTADAGFEIGVQRTLPIPPERAWNLITRPEGRMEWLGTIARMHWAPGTTYETAEGTTGEVRTVQDGSRLRLTFQPRGWRAPSTLQVTVVPVSRGASVRFHQERLASAEQREQMREHWRTVLDSLAERVESR
jgi:uncharacterized protein YndB with AHSA1/START domain